jgi:hypothetical protein
MIAVYLKYAFAAWSRYFAVRNGDALSKCNPDAKWPDFKAELSRWRSLKQLHQESQFKEDGECGI